jgi:hypothetical protein
MCSASQHSSCNTGILGVFSWISWKVANISGSSILGLNIEFSLVVQVGFSFVLDYKIVQLECRPDDLAAIFQIGFIKIGTKNVPLGCQQTKSLLNLDAQT